MNWIKQVTALTASCVVVTLASAQQPDPKDLVARLQATEMQRNAAASESAAWYARFVAMSERNAELEKRAKECKPEEKK